MLQGYCGPASPYWASKAPTRHLRVQAQGTGHRITARCPDGTVHRARLTPDGVAVESTA
ncbi:MAG: hypothetical protein JWL99_4715, partial [Streptomyces oryziradicis]|nr:hypothetical protein [Actinacidiphila oryziradicis]